MRQNAAAAGVAVETVYAVGGKAAVFLRAFELAFSGTPAGASLLDLEARAPVWAAETLEDLLAGLTGFLADSNARSAGLLRARVEAAETDPDLAVAYRARLADMRADGHRILVGAVRRGLCAPPRDSRRTVDEVWVTVDPSRYVLLVDHAGRDRHDDQR